MALMQRWQAAVKAHVLYLGSGGVIFKTVATLTAAAATAAATAGSVASLIGGAGLTSGAGGVGKAVGGAGGATGAGGAAQLTGGVGGTTSGAGGAAQVAGGAATAGNSAGGVASVTGGAGQGTGAGGAASLVGGASGAGATGDGGAVGVTGGAAASTNGNGGSVVLTGGAKTGSGIAGGIRIESIIIRKQGAPTAKTVSATLTAAELLTGIVTINQGAGATSAQQLPTGTAIQAALPVDFAVDDSFDISVMNISTVDAEDASITTNTDLTLVGSMDFPAHSGITLCSCGILRFRKTADHAFSVYRVG